MLVGTLARRSVWWPAVSPAGFHQYDQKTVIRVEFRRGQLRAIVVGLVLTGFFAAAAIMAAVWPDRFLANAGDDTTVERLIASGCGCMFGGFFLVMLFAIPGALQRRGLDFDPHGIWWWEGDKRMVFPWPEIAAVGVGFMRSPSPTNLTRMKQGQALEIYPRGVPFEQRFPDLTRFRVSEEPPAEGLPPVRYRILLPPLDGASGQVANAVRHFAPGLWLGEYQRTWHRIPGK